MTAYTCHFPSNQIAWKSPHLASSLVASSPPWVWAVELLCRLCYVGFCLTTVFVSHRLDEMEWKSHLSPRILKIMTGNNEKNDEV